MCRGCETAWDTGESQPFLPTLDVGRKGNEDSGCRLGFRLKRSVWWCSQHAAKLGSRQPARAHGSISPILTSGHHVGSWESDPMEAFAPGKSGLFFFLKRAQRRCFWPHRAAHGVLAPQRGTEPRVTAVKVLSPKPWTAGEPLRARGYTFSSTPLQEHLATAWPKSPSRFFRYILQKNLSELLGQPSTNGKDKRRKLF